MQSSDLKQVTHLLSRALFFISKYTTDDENPSISVSCPEDGMNSSEVCEEAG